MISPPAKVLVQQLPHGSGIDISPLQAARIEQHGQNQILQLVTSPVNQRQSEALFGPIQRLSGHAEPLRQFPENIFLLAASHLPWRGESRGPLEKNVIDHGCSRFQRGQHTHPVYLGENVCRQIRFGIKVKQTA